MPTRALVVLLGLLALLGLSTVSGCAVGRSPDWKQADLDRNVFNLALYRGRTSDLEKAMTGEQLAARTEHGEVVSGAGRAGLLGEKNDLDVVVRYAAGRGGWLSGTSDEVTWRCYRFTTPDGYDVAFKRIRC